MTCAMALQVYPGRADPLGATFDGAGVNFALFVENAAGAELCLFDQPGQPATQPIPTPTRYGPVRHGCVGGASPGQRYGFRVSGPYAPDRGLRFNPNKLLLDPYARAVAGGGV